MPLTDPRVINVGGGFGRDNFSALHGARCIAAVKPSGQVAEKLLLNLPLYTFRRDHLRTAGVNFIPSRISTRSDALVVTFVPAKQGRFNQPARSHSAGFLLTFR